MRSRGIPPAIAIDQTNPVRTSRSTVGTMTELNDHAEAAFRACGSALLRGCGRPVAARYARPLYTSSSPHVQKRRAIRA